LGAISASDGHSIYEIGSSWTEIDSPDLIIKQNFQTSFKSSIRNTNLKSKMKKTNSIIGALDYSINLFWLNGLAPKLKLNRT